MSSLPQEALHMLGEALVNNIPFNRHIGLTYQTVSEEECVITFDMKPELVGNYIQGILHGGVISSAMDMVGGTMAAVGILHSNPATHLEELQKKIAKLSTIDLRVDFLRPGRGKQFIARAELLRAGKRVAVVRTELRNEEGVQIAVATGSFMVG
ncbi:thioesterase family protein [Kangiella sediminilitoris]|uniref:Medium/long-chain acyl-CoA thioesterase YigI n=1 Tax=Kangiella sediminilitoris TaxID=1144748 RepID=A0A1B3BDK7_9GAMM|nr:thioesterase family protein [Kangiella sediminilitoris]AOE50902.1 Thioesterase superfamily protein [Kangiella sediminilitoris]